MIKLLGDIPKERFYLAVSGGMDSMVALDFLLNGKYKPIVLNFNHGTEFGRIAKKFIRRKCKEFDLPLMIANIDNNFSQGDSKENYWRDERYSFFNKIPGKIITMHHLDDATEWYIFSSLHGYSKLIPYSRDNVIRPFLLTSKKEIKGWAERKNVEYIDDPANKDEKYMRSIVRHKIMPQALRVNPGLRTVVRKKLENEYHGYEYS